MSVSVQQQLSPGDLSAISATIEGSGYTSEEALYSVNSIKLDEFRDTIKSVKFKDIIEEHEDVLTFKRSKPIKPNKLIGIFDTREVTPSPTSISNDDNDLDFNERPLYQSEIDELANESDDCAIESSTESEDIEDTTNLDNKNDSTSFSDNADFQVGLGNDYKLDKNIDSIKIVNIPSDSIRAVKSRPMDVKSLPQKAEVIDTDSESGSEHISSNIIKALKNTWKRPNSLQLNIVNLEKEVETLKACNKVQHGMIENYEKNSYDLQTEINVIKMNYEKCQKNNTQLCDKVKALTDELENTKIELDVVSKLNEIEKSYKPTEIQSVTVSNEKRFETVKKMMHSLELKNEFLHQALVFVTKRANNIYRHTLSPALFLFSEETESASTVPTFDSGNSVQEFIDANLELFRQVNDINQIVDLSNEKVFNLKKEQLLQGLTDYFDELNEKIATKLEMIASRHA